MQWWPLCNAGVDAPTHNTGTKAAAGTINGTLQRWLIPSAPSDSTDTNLLRVTGTIEGPILGSLYSIRGRRMMQRRKAEHQIAKELQVHARRRTDTPGLECIGTAVAVAVAAAAAAAE